ncbi:MAG: serine/threonine-protein kinase [Gemmatimonadaceae bacterium]
MTALDDLRARLGGRYEIERELGRGGMGAVYLARDVKLGRLVALKVLPPEFATQVALRERFLRETRTAASFSHPNIVPVYAIEEADDFLAYVMGYVEGESMAERVHRAGPLATRETVKLLQDVGYALAYAHGRGVVHRDIKPDNIMIERATGRALVMDFGVARLISAPDPSAKEGLTRVGEVVGTPEYMSPEQATGDHVDGRSDLYSLGLAAYYAVTGQVAMAADSTGKSLAKQITEILPPIGTLRPDLPAALSEAIDRCLMKEPDARFANAESLVEALDSAQLSAPEIPVAIRMFAQEAGTISLVIAGGGVLVAFMITQIAGNTESLDVLLPIILVFSVLMTRFSQTFAEARRLAVDGFTPELMNRGMTAVVEERASRRAALRANPESRRERNRALRSGAIGIVLAIAMFIYALSIRRQTSPHSYQSGYLGSALIISAAILFGVSFARLARSPFRMPIGETMFRVIWLGPIGRGLVRFAGRKVARSSSGVSGVAIPRPVAQRSAPSVAVAAPADRLGQLESRVAELEKWRKAER